jgi:predicted DNA-binding WGR domain protein
MTAVHLGRVDPARNMRRFYRLDMQPDLFGGVLLVKEWGRIGARAHGCRVVRHGSPCRRRLAASGRAKEAARISREMTKPNPTKLTLPTPLTAANKRKINKIKALSELAGISFWSAEQEPDYDTREAILNSETSSQLTT